MKSDFSEHDIFFELELNVSVEKVWNQWTTKEGIGSFFSPHFNVDFRIDGAFEMLFDPMAPKGSRGSEGMRIAAMEKHRMLSFTWNSPPSIPETRSQRTFVNILFIPLQENKTKLVLRNLGYGFSAEWEKAVAYFKEAWGNSVLPRLKYSLEKGPIDWDNRPDLSEYHLYLEGRVTG